MFSRCIRAFGVWRQWVPPLLLVLAANISRAEPWKFAVIGDTRRGGEKSDFTSTNGVRVSILRPLAEDIVSQGVDLVVFTGDLSLGNVASGPLTNQWSMWTNAMTPLYAARIPILLVRGNHELGQTNNLRDWRWFFPDIPRNGPPGQEGATYKVVHKNATFIAMDQFVGKNKGFNSKVYNSATNSGMISPWVIDEIKNAETPWVFPFGHEPAFIGGHLDGLANVPKERDAMWKALAGRHDGGIYLCGHDHMYVNRWVSTQWGHPVRELIVGCGGAPYAPYNHAATNHVAAPKYRIREQFVNSAMGPACNTNQLPAYFGYVVMSVDEKKLHGEWRALTNVDTNSLQVVGTPQFQVFDRFDQKAR